jgi:pimeloyl-ACP methyl ester carboxylesterase
LGRTRSRLIACHAEAPMSRLAIAVIHGIGGLTKAEPEQTAARTFSEPLRYGLIARLGAETVARDIAWREIFWNDLIQPRQDRFEARHARRMPVGPLRRFVISGLGDAGTYAWSPDPCSIYQRIHARVAAALDALEADTGGGPLLLVAHSMGGHILSNFLWDRLKRPTPGATAFQRIETLAALVTFGCNIPVFAFSHDPVCAIAPPDTPHRLRPWWRNYYAPADPLGFPLAASGGGYAALAAGPDPELIDDPVWPGIPLIQSATPWSHTAYWTSASLLDPLARTAAAALAR